MRWFRIRPLDVIFFRRSGPFSAGGVFAAETLEYPHIMPFIGAFRAKAAQVIGLRPDDLRKQHPKEHEILGGPNTLGKLSFIGPFFEKEGLVYVPMPFCLGFPSPEEKSTPKLGKDTEFKLTWAVLKQPLDGEYSSLGKNLLNVIYKKGYQFYENAFIEADLLYQVLIGGKIPPGKIFEGHKPVKQIEDFLVIERRIGVGLDYKKRISKEGLLYSQSLIRLKEGVGFVVGVDGLPDNFPARGVLQLGGEGKLAYFEERKSPNLFNKKPNPDHFEDVNRIILILLTPGIFDKEIPTNIEGLNGAKVLGIALGKPVIVAGWNIAQNRPRPLYKAISPGACYWIEFEKPLKDRAQKLIENFWAKPLSENTQDYAFKQAGFGLAFLGKIDT